MSKIIELKTDEDLKNLLNTDYFSSKTSIEKSRIKSDFSKNYFKCLLNQNETEINGFILFCNNYSTWQHRVLHISDLWLKESFNYSEKEAVLNDLIQYLFQFARENCYHRINIYVSNAKSDLTEMLSKLGAVNLTKEEDWLIFEMGKEEMKEFTQHSTTNLENFELVRVNDINKYAELIKDSIRKMAVYEKLEDQMETTVEELVRDFADEKNRFYEVVLMFSKNTKEIVGFSIFYLKYEAEKGLGIYLDELFIEEKFRNSGLGTFLWRHVVRDVLSTHQVSYMQWNVLGWNKPAIDFYHKHKSVDLTGEKGLLSFRFRKTKIYS